jgi:hypothetical protein
LWRHIVYIKTKAFDNLSSSLLRYTPAETNSTPIKPKNQLNQIQNSKARKHVSSPHEKGAQLGWSCESGRDPVAKHTRARFTTTSSKYKRSTEASID